MTCCNHNCDEGRDCPDREPLTVAELLDVPPFSLDRVMLARFFLGVFAVLILVGALGWLAVTLWPVIAASINN